ncbi:MAG: OmpA family protein [Desulfobulbaceae bacterium]|nr:OmpA family protein [Desulfobulbaceae bacterium]
MKKIPVLLCCLFLFLALPLLVKAELPNYVRGKMGSLGGQIFVDGKAQSYAVVAFFNDKNGPPSLTEGLGRVPEFLSRTDAGGAFKINLPSGRYFVGILVRSLGMSPGPPRPGEKFYFAAADQGKLLLLSVNEQEHQEAGRINGAPHWSFHDPTQYFTVGGVIRKENGDPVANVVVLGKSRLNIPRPEYISGRTASDGAFSLKLPAGRPFYLMARQDIASSRPPPGSLVGTYGIHSKIGLATLNLFSAGTPPPGVTDHEENSRAVTVSGRGGETRSSIDIYMYPVPDPEVVKKSVQGSVIAPKFDLVMPNNRILFEGKSGRPSERSFLEIDQWVAFLLDKEELDIELIGYTDNLGTPGENFPLTERQARTVAEYFIAHGVNGGRIKVVGMGALNPVATNRHSAGRSKNCRVEIKVVEGNGSAR